ncbi:transporter substrate-binding domain-containing protein [Kineosporia babensis]|uniref:Transporter substrate-binding domain-containing protein n=1 Tax=Kineosporia babensis TaxID=499548 RepID=A0A9X1NP43_9ACTN|nr:transporter substrate-binding domain-containing protein [Kineosporia babensis]MCD5316701.1 transporter substrate-binding domain-containing protein [Kineosporia babensis]
MRRSLVTVAAAALLALGTGCAGATGATDPDDVPADLSRALPAHESGPAQASPSASPKCDDADQSYAPLPSLPDPATFADGTTLAQIRDRGRLIVGTAGDKPLLSVRNPRTGQLEGIDIELAKAMAEAILGDAGRVEFRTMPYGGREKALIEGDVDLVAHSMTMTCDRWQRVGFSAEYYRDGQRLLVREDSAVQEIEDLAETGGSVCVAKGTTTIEEVRRRQVENVVAVADAADCLAYFQRDEVDAITSNVLILAGYQLQDGYARIVGERLSDEPIALGFRKDDVEFIRYANRVLADLRENGSLERIFTQRMRDTGVQPDLGTPGYGRGEG